MKKFNKIIGEIGELKAQKYLKKIRYKIIETNYKNKIGEIDIIAKDREKFVFIEVKNRETLTYGYPSESVEKRKQNKIRKVAELFLLQNKLYDVLCQFDVIEIVGNELNHIRDCF